LEESGKVRRGYFIEGLGGAQFALPGAVDRLRGPEDDAVVALASTDPANPYGSALDWPLIEEGRLGRIAGTYVVLASGRLVAFVDGKKVRLIDHDPGLTHPVAGAIADVAARHRRTTLDTVDGEPIAAAPLGRALTEFGFRHTHRGLRIDARR
jgi:ATP-dependent Lhr-like helicase